jgi:hypothetical protein
MEFKREHFKIRWIAIDVMGRLEWLMWANEVISRNNGGGE